MRHRRRRSEETSYWLSYSDMMAGLLLTFVLIIAFTMLHAQMDYDEKQLQLAGKEEELMASAAALDKEREIVSNQQEQLNAQEEALAKQGEKIAIQEETLKEQHELLNKLEAVMSEQQQKLDDLIGIRKEIVEELSREFDDSDLKVAVDEKTGAITFDSSILFDYNKAVITPSGKEFLAEFMPRYAEVLLGSKYKDNISEIIIEGHTDTEGKYMFNLQLSQKRALAVAEFCLDDDSKILKKNQMQEMRSLLSATGRSYSNPIYDADGKVDMDASRRVEILFRLKDEEMVREMMEILSEEAGQN
ncbi:MAG: OmpA family protein [Butyrivibrio sp.]|nr:OmpA family protein [Butyrivibrio sp.]